MSDELKCRILERFSFHKFIIYFISKRECGHYVLSLRCISDYESYFNAILHSSTAEISSYRFQHLAFRLIGTYSFRILNCVLIFA